MKWLKMDRKIRKLEIEYKSSPTLETAEKLVRAKNRLDLTKIKKKHLNKKWKELKNGDCYLQLPHGILYCREYYDKAGLAFIPNIYVEE